MSTLNKAARTLAYSTTLGPGVCQDLAEILANDGLLAPDTDHPATLTTEEDFAAAPIGTVILHPWGAAIKQSEDNWSVTGDDMARHHGTVGLNDEYPSTVLRWGPGEEVGQ